MARSGKSGIRMEFFSKGKFRRFNDEAAIARANVRSAEFAEADAHLRMIPHNKTGDTDRGIDHHVDAHRGWSLLTDEDAAWFLEFGTRRHDIFPTPDHMVQAAAAGHLAWLHWIDPLAGPVYAQTVDHPGQRATPILKPAIRENAGTFSDFIAEEVEREWD